MTVASTHRRGPRAGLQHHARMLRVVARLGYELNLFLDDGSVTRRPSSVLQPTAVVDYLAVPEGWSPARPESRPLPLEEEVAMMGREPLESVPHVLHVCHSLAALQELEGREAVALLESLRRSVLGLEPETLQLVREQWDSETRCWL